jgi:hypothetical protein
LQEKSMLESLGSDLRFGARTLWKSRAFSAIAIITLALGVGASSAIFSVIDNILLEPFPYPAAQRLMSLVIHDTDQSNPGGRGAFTGAEFLDYSTQNHVFENAIGMCFIPPVRVPNVSWACSSRPIPSNFWAFSLCWDVPRKSQTTSLARHLPSYCVTKRG